MTKTQPNKTQEEKQSKKNPALARAILISVFLFCIAAGLLLFFLNKEEKNTYSYSPETKILLYHLVRDETYGDYEYLFVRESDFENQLLEIQRLGYQTVFADELSKLKDGEKAVVLTFDDGYSDCYDTVYPLLQKYGMKATFFISTALLGEENHLTEAQILEMQESGLCRFGSHTVTHIRLDEALTEEAERELSESKKALEDLTGEKIISLAYPNGAYNDLVELLAEKCGYLYCYTTNAPTEPYYENTALPRSYVVRDMTAEEFSAILK
ncbi:MAG: polysaccharide deacetylase family protein [Ruminococcaceae bacterium]|nr:polysaccharide deacetylase family protein [Oscillospiraceae bacterium]